MVLCYRGGQNHWFGHLPSTALRVLSKSSDTGWLNETECLMKTAKWRDVDNRSHMHVSRDGADGCKCSHTSDLVATFSAP